MVACQIVSMSPMVHRNVAAPTIDTPKALTKLYISLTNFLQTACTLLRGRNINSLQ